MALSNWDTLAIGPDGKSTTGVFQSGKFSIEIYKNWAYISNPDMWTEDGGYTKDVICTVYSGNMGFGGLNIKAQRGNQNSIQLLVESGYGENRKIFAGIGCYGFADHSKEYLESKGYKYPEDGYLFTTWRRGENEQEGKEYIGWHENGKEVLVPIDEGVDLHPFIGVNQETLNEFKKFLVEELELDKDYFSEEDKKWFDSIQWDDLLRYNQGDAYFAGALESDTIPGTEVGKQEDPIFLQALVD